MWGGGREKETSPFARGEKRKKPKALVLVWFVRGRGRHDVRAVLGEGPLRLRSSASTVEFADEGKLRVRLGAEDEFWATLRRVDDELHAYVATLGCGTVARLIAGPDATFKARCGSTMPCRVESGTCVCVTVEYAGVVTEGRRHRNDWTVVSVDGGVRPGGAV